MTTTILVLTIASVVMFVAAMIIDNSGFCSGCKYNGIGNIQRCIWNCPREKEDKND